MTKVEKCIVEMHHPTQLIHLEPKPIFFLILQEQNSNLRGFKFFLISSLQMILLELSLSLESMASFALQMFLSAYSLGRLCGF